MKIGDIVKEKDSGVYGLVHYSRFGYSIHYYDEIYKHYGKTLGMSEDELLKFWEIVDVMPEGYIIDEHGWIRSRETVGREKSNLSHDKPHDPTREELKDIFGIDG